MESNSTDQLSFHKDSIFNRHKLLLPQLSSPRNSSKLELCPPRIDKSIEEEVVRSPQEYFRGKRDKWKGYKNDKRQHRGFVKGTSMYKYNDFLWFKRAIPIGYFILTYSRNRIHVLL
jgi:hypothetical protein